MFTFRYKNGKHEFTILKFIVNFLNTVNLVTILPFSLCLITCYMWLPQNTKFGAILESGSIQVLIVKAYFCEAEKCEESKYFFEFSILINIMRK